MKKFIAILAAALVGTAAIAQDSGWSVGGSIDFASFKGAGSSFVFAPDIVYALNDTFNVGATMSFEKNAWDFAPYVCYYFGGNEKAYFFADAFVDLWSEKDPVSKDRYTSWGVGVDAGIEIALTDRFCIDLYFGNIGYDADAESFGFNIGPAKNITFYYSF